jgi:hypothetical protein
MTFEKLWRKSYNRKLQRHHCEILQCKDKVGFLLNFSALKTRKLTTYKASVVNVGRCKCKCGPVKNLQNIHTICGRYKYLGR